MSRFLHDVQELQGPIGTMVAVASAKGLDPNSIHALQQMINGPSGELRQLVALTFRRCGSDGALPHMDDPIIAEQRSGYESE